MADFNVPSSNVTIKALGLPDSDKALNALLTRAYMLRRLAGLNGRGSGTGGTGSGTGKGSYIAVPDSSDPKGYRLEWVPGTSASERTANLAVMEGARKRNVLNTLISQDKDISGKLQQLQSSEIDVGSKEKILSDIRKNDAARLAQAAGLDSSEVFDTMLEPIETQVTQQKRAVQEASGLSSIWDSLKLGGMEAINTIKSFRASAPERLANARELNKEREEIIANNAFLRDQELRQAAGEGAFSRMTGDTGSVAGVIGSALGEMLPTAGAMIGSAAAGGAAGSLAGPVGAAIGGLIGGSGSGAVIEQQALANRIANDPTLTDEQKIQAIEEGTGQAALVGAAMGAVPAGAGKIGSLVKSGMSKAAPKIVAQAASNKAAQGFMGRYAGATARSAAELGVMNTIGTVGQNVIVADVTGQEISPTQGLGQSLEQGLIAAPFFALPGTIRSRQTRGTGRPEGTAERPTPAPGSTGEAPMEGAAERITRGPRGDAPGTETLRVEETPQERVLQPDIISLADQEFGRVLRKSVQNQVAEGILPTREALLQAFKDAGKTEKDFTRWLDINDTLADSARLNADTISMLRGEAFKTHPNITPALEKLSQAARKLKGTDIESAKKAITEAIDSGIDVPTIEKFLTDAAKANNVLKETPDALIRNKLTATQRSLLADALQARELREIIDAQKIQGVINEGITTSERSGAVSEAARVGRPQQGREGTIDTGNIVSDRGVATDTRATPEAIAAAIPQENIATNQRIEGQRVGRTEESSNRTGQIYDETTTGVGIPPAERAYSGRGVEATTIRDATTSGGAGELGGAAGKRTENVRDAAAIGRRAQPHGKIAPQNAREILNTLPQKVHRVFNPNPKRVVSPEPVSERALDLLVREAVGEKLTPQQYRQLKALREAGIGELDVPIKLQESVEDAKNMGLKTNAKELVEAEIDAEAAIRRVVENIWCSG